MPAFIEECRYEWKRLGVPDSLAEEMASELEADLAEAQADGVSAAEMLGESDPRRFAATWARERGLVAEPPPKKSRKWVWIGLAVGCVLLFVALPALALIGTSSGGGSVVAQVTPPQRQNAITVPKLVGLTVCTAFVRAQHAGLRIHAPDGPCEAVVIEQRPHAGAIVRRPTAATTAVKLWVRRPRG